MPVQPTAATVDGPVHKVPCAHCGKPNDLRVLQKDLGESFEPGTSYQCDHCHRLNRITKVVPTLVIQVRQM